MSNPDGKHSFYDLDESWYRYMMADREGRKRMCRDALDCEAVVLGVFVVLFIVGGVLALHYGII